MADACKKKHGKKDRALAERNTAKRRSARIERDRKDKAAKRKTASARLIARKRGALNRIQARMHDPNSYAPAAQLMQVGNKCVAALARAIKESSE